MADLNKRSLVCVREGHVLQVGYLNVQRSKGEKIPLAWLPEVG